MLSSLDELAGCTTTVQWAVFLALDGFTTTRFRQVLRFALMPAPDTLEDSTELPPDLTLMTVSPTDRGFEDALPKEEFTFLLALGCSFGLVHLNPMESLMVGMTIYPVEIKQKCFVLDPLKVFTFFFQPEYLLYYKLI